ncbi:YfcC family protein [Bacillus sp. EAC]|uniref:YfcC family protein n=1 Tax=Bacillus sp. EAC TaxID=1978338 RepID=UPI000B43150F|nr:YfcC family protein [Bacillus sp. EAC]
MNDTYGIKLGKKAFFQSVIILLILMIISGVLTKFFTPGHYERVMKDGVQVVNPDSFTYLSNSDGLSALHWIFAPILVLFSKDALITITIILFILIVGGSFAVFDAIKIFEVIIERFLNKYENSRFLLILIFSLFFMILGAVFGILEEVVPLIPIMILVAERLGWDKLMGLGLSLLSVSFGFSAALFNPFTIGIAQQLANVPLFSGMGYRIFIFITTYLILVAFLVWYAKKLEKRKNASESIKQKSNGEVEKFNVTKNSLIAILSGFIILCLIMIVMPIIGLADYSMPIIAVSFLLISIISGKLNNVSFKRLLSIFGKGAINLSPSAILILLAMGVKYIVETSNVMDSILYSTANALNGQSPYLAGFYMYLIVFALQFFIPSATAKAFLVMPILTPLGDLVGITRQSVVLAFNFGDGFSHVLYPSNPMLLIALSLAAVNYWKWIKWTILLQAVLFVITVVFLFLAIHFNYGPI